MHVNECLEFYMHETQNETSTSTYSMILFTYVNVLMIIIKIFNI